MDEYIVWLRLGFVVVMLVAGAIDWRRRIIPDWISVGGMAVSLFVAAVGGGLSGAVIGVVAGLGSGLLLRYAGSMLLRKRIEQAQRTDPEVDCAFGMGDVKLMGFVGAVLGWHVVYFVYLFGSIAGALVGIGIRLRTGGGVVPFGPFAAAGAIAYCLWF